MNKENESIDNIKLKIEQILSKNKEFILEDLTVEKLIEEVNIYYQELVYQNEELIRTRNDLEISEKKYIDIYNNAPIGYVIIDESGIIKNVNNTLAEMLNISKYNLKDKPFSDLIDPESQDTFYFHIKNLKANYISQTCNLYLTNKIYVNLHSNIYSDTENYIRISITNLTEYKKSQDQIKESEEKFSKIFKLSPDVIIITSIKEGKIIEANNSFFSLSEYTPEEIKDKTIIELNIWFNLNKRELVIRLLKEKGKIENLEFLFCSKYKKIYNCLISCEVIYLNNEKYILSVIHNITEQKKIEEEIRELNQHLEEIVKERTKQLEQTNKDLEGFAYSVSHDLRAPLRHIDGFTRLLKNSMNIITEDSEQYFDKINKSTKKMSKMIDDLLKFSRLGRKDLDKTSVNLNKLVSKIIEQYKIDITNRKIEFRIGTLPIIQGDQGLLQIVFENLISNSIKFTSKKEFAVIEINQCKRSDTQCTVYIKDNGVGFDMAYVDKLFGVFQRLHTESEFSGTGIGLANIKQIIQKHGGSIYAESEINKGATFYINL